MTATKRVKEDMICKAINAEQDPMVKMEMLLAVVALKQVLAKATRRVNGS